MSESILDLTVTLYRASTVFFWQYATISPGPEQMYGTHSVRVALLLLYWKQKYVKFVQIMLSLSLKLLILSSLICISGLKPAESKFSFMKNKIYSFYCHSCPVHHT